jgi:hypothetical protein
MRLGQRGWPEAVGNGDGVGEEEWADRWGSTCQ